MLETKMIDDFEAYTDGQDLDGVNGWSTNKTFTAFDTVEGMVGKLLNTPGPMMLVNEFDAKDTTGYWFMFDLFSSGMGFESSPIITLRFYSSGTYNTVTLKLGDYAQGIIHHIAIPVAMSSIDKVYFSFPGFGLGMFLIDNVRFEAPQDFGVTPKYFDSANYILQQYKEVT